MNPYMYIYALSVSLQHRTDTKGIPIPSLAEIFPEKYIAKSVFTKVKEQSYAVPVEERVSIKVFHIILIKLYLGDYWSAFSKFIKPRLGER